MTKTLTAPPARKIAKLLERAVAKAVSLTGSPRYAASLAHRLSHADRAAATAVFDTTGSHAAGPFFPRH